MRYVGSAAVIALAILFPSLTLGQSGLSITNYQVVSQFGSSVTYRADLVNTGVALGTVTATVRSTDPFTIRTVPNQETLNFVKVPANGQITSTNTFTLLLANPSNPLDTSKLQWSFTSTPSGPIANAGPNQTVKVGSLVTLDASGSSNPSGNGTLMYSWTFAWRPVGSFSTLSSINSVMPTFVADVLGTWVLTLTVSNGTDFDIASMTVTTSAGNTPPVANAGPNQTLPVGSTAVLNGSGSTSSNGNPLTYAWTLTSKPAGSAAALVGANTVSPTFVVDKPGTYMAQLIVNDGLPGSPSTVTITTTPVPPVANAGPNQVVNVNSLVQLNGAGSSDASGLPLTYQWTLISLPAGSAAALNNPTGVNPTFTADRPGIYVAQLIVNNGILNSTPSTVTITTQAPLAPTANAGVNQTVPQNSTVTLHGSGTDPQNLPLTFQWALINKPAGSAANLSSTVIPNPTFVADLPGNYVAQLTVNNGFLSSPPSTVTISTTCAPPTANAGPNQNVATGATVTLDGSASGDVCHDPLTYAWSFTTRSVGSNATLSGANTVSPSFVADVAGMYVVQLIVNNGFTNSNPATVTITAGSASIALSPSVLNLTTAPGTLTVSTSTPAGPGGLVVSLTSSNTNVATVPPNVTIPQGATSTPMTITPGNTSGAATITATAPGATPGTATVNVTSSGQSGIIIPSTLTVPPGQTAQFPLTLRVPAPPGGVFIALASSDTSKVTVSPPNIFISQGNTAPNASPTVTGLTVGSATVTAAAFGFPTASSQVQVTSGTGMSFLPSSLTISGAGTQNLTLILSAPAPAGGLNVSLNSSNPLVATVPPSVSFSVNTPNLSVPVTGVAAGTATITASATGIPSATASVTVTPPGAINIPANTTVGVGQSAAFPVSLSAPAPAGGVTVTLVSSDTSRATVTPSSVSIAGGATTPAAQPQVNGIAAGSANITATAPGYTQGSGQVQVTTGGGSSSFSPATITINAGATGDLTLSLSGPAPAGGLTVSLNSSNPAAATVPATVGVGANATSANVQVTGVAAGSATITANTPGFGSASANVTVYGGGASGILVPANTVIQPGQTAPFSVVLANPAPPSGVFIALASSDVSKVTVSPTNIFIGPGSISPNASPTVTGVGVGSATITASAFGFTTASGQVVVTSGMALSFSPPSLTINGAITQNIALVLSGPAPAGGLTVHLNSSDPTKATVPPTVTIGASLTSANVPVTGLASGSTTISASAAGVVSAQANVNIVVVQPQINVPATTSVGLGQSTAFAITLSQTAASNVTVTLASSDPSKVTVSPSTVTILAGATQPATQPQVTGAGIGSATVTASATGFNSGSGTVNVTPPVMQFAGNLTLNAAARGNLTLNLTGGQAPAGGLTVNLNSDNTNAATVPATVSFPAGATSVPVTVTAGPVQSTQTANITASASGIANATATVTVNPVGGISVSSATVGLNQSTTLTVSLPAPAVSAVTVNLVSSDTTKVTVSPASVTIAAGATTPATQPQVTGVGAGTANITGSASGFASGSGTVTVTPLAMSFSPPTLTVGSNSQGTLTLNLTGGQAPAGGLTVNLSSDKTNVATVPATVNIAGGGTSAPVNVTSLLVQTNQTANITASATGIPSTTAQVIVTQVPTITIAPVNVGLGQSANLQVTLSQAALSAVTVTLASSDATKVSVSSATITIPQGATQPTTPPQVTGLAAGSPAATITGSATGYASGSGAVNVTVTMSFSPSSLPVSPGAQGTLTLNLTGGQAPPAGLTVNLNSSNTSVATVPATVNFSAGATSANVTVTGVAAGTANITASAPNIAPATATVNNIAPSISVANIPSLGLGMSATLAVTLSAPAVAPVTVNLVSSDTTKVTVPASVSIAQGATAPATQPMVTAAGIGSATITASATGYTNGSGTVTVPAPTLSFSPSTLGVSPGAQGTLTLNMTGGQAPAGGLTVNLSSSNPGVATVPSTVNFAAGANSATVTVTGVGGGTTTITASAPNIQQTTATVTVTGPSISVGNVNLGLGFSGNLTITLSQAATAPVTVNLASSDTTKVTLSTASVVIPQGATTPGTQPTVTGVGIGQSTISASATGITTGTGTVTVTAPTLSLAPTGLTITAGAQGTLMLSMTGGQAPPNGLLISLISNAPSVATVPGTVTIPAGQSSANISVTGVAAGTSMISAFIPGVTPATATVTVQNPTGGGLMVQNASVGQSLQTVVKISIPSPATDALSINVASSDATKVVVSARQTDAGTPQTSVTIPPGATSIGVFVQGLASSGTVTLTASSQTVPTGTGTITLTPSGFLLTGPNGTSNVTTNVGAAPTTLTLTSARLDSGNNFVEPQAVRGGSPVNVTFNSTNPGTGTIPAVSFPAGASMASVQFTPTTDNNSKGSTTLTAVGPAGFSTPASGNAVTFNVLAATFVPSNLTVGKNLQATANITLAGGAPGSLQITVTNNNPSLIALSCPAGTSQNVCAPSGSGILLTLQAGRTTTSDFIIAGLASSGTATYSAMSTGFVTATGTVTLGPSGIVIAGPGGVGAASFVVFTPTTNISVLPALLDSSLNYVATQAVAAGLSATVNVTSSNPAVGTVNPSTVTVTGGTSAGITTFQRGGGSGNTVLSVNTPAGFSTPAQDTTVTATILTPSFALSCDGASALIGQNLQMSGCTASVSPAPASDATVTITSNSSQLLVSASDTIAGAASVTVTIPAGSTTSNAFTLQSLANSGMATYTASAPTFQSKTGTVTLAPAGLAFTSQFFLASVSGGPVPVTVFTAVINPADNTFAGTQPLRGGFSPPLAVTLTSGSPTVGTITSPVSIIGGSDHAVAQFTPKSPGSSTISVTPPPGFVPVLNHSTIGAQVSP